MLTTTDPTDCQRLAVTAAAHHDVAITVLDKLKSSTTGALAMVRRVVAVAVGAHTFLGAVDPLQVAVPTAPCTGAAGPFVPPTPAAAAVSVKVVRQCGLARARRASRHANVGRTRGDEHPGETDRTCGLVGIRTGEHAGPVVQDPVEFSFGSSRYAGLSCRPQLAHSHIVLPYRASVHARHRRTRSWREYISVGLTEHCEQRGTTTLVPPTF
jgi:hypothetical protein